MLQDYLMEEELEFRCDCSTKISVHFYDTATGADAAAEAFPVRSIHAAGKATVFSPTFKRADDVEQCGRWDCEEETCSRSAFVSINAAYQYCHKVFVMIDRCDVRLSIPTNFDK
ncbi:Hypothetical predicted protein [Scomber scombrus]|uniref:Uncharacterized protein n=1 Tax=Scomber scombrus TaxID=13677 RepID=A0AAV1PSW0_SCOSC